MTRSKRWVQNHTCIEMPISRETVHTERDRRFFTLNRRCLPWNAPVSGAAWTTRLKSIPRAPETQLSAPHYATRMKVTPTTWVSMYKTASWIPFHTVREDVNARDPSGRISPRTRKAPLPKPYRMLTTKIFICLMDVQNRLMDGKGHTGLELCSVSGMLCRPIRFGIRRVQK